MKAMLWENLVDRAKWAPDPWDGEAVAIGRWVRRLME